MLVLKAHERRGIGMRRYWGKYQQRRAAIGRVSTIED
jgi:hypothetical protein